MTPSRMAEFGLETKPVALGLELLPFACSLLPDSLQCVPRQALPRLVHPAFPFPRPEPGMWPWAQGFTPGTRDGCQGGNIQALPEGPLFLQ